MIKKCIKNIGKVLIVIMLVVISSSSIGCMKNKKTEKTESNSNFDIKAAGNVTDTYMKYLIKDDLENSKKLYSKDLLKSSLPQENKNLKILGYNISEINEVGKSGLFKVRVSRSDLNNSFASLDEYSIKISKEDNDYKIKETNNTVQKEVFAEGGQIRSKNKNNVNTSLVVDMDGLPTYAFPRDDKSNTDKIKVPKSKFGMVNLGYSGESLAVSTYDKDVFIGLIKIDESLEVQGGENKDQGEKGDGAGKTNEGGGTTKGREKPVGKEITSIDILKDCKVEVINFSPSEKFITVQYVKPSSGKCIRVYKVDGGDIIPFKFEEKYPLDKVNVIFSSYDKENLNFDVMPKTEGDKSASNVIGKWQLSLKDFKAKKM
ncbi:hypothetical protein HBE96_05425 [Clostridium sp. P21]|uniref:Lipoprotein n=1 Tax=Clostridium muellerianum TaxID=2716538 RepID=A0A7Y0EEY8_9CLOT|nr:hypothetical protein [Clostridium muellerianum]NMM62136.1 hypothetical protein [Clostridium muellerianum]